MKRQNIRIKNAYDEKAAAMPIIQKKYEKAQKELTYLQDQRRLFEQADADRSVLTQKIGSLEGEIDRLKEESEEFEFKLKSTEKELEQARDDLVNIDENFAECRFEVTRLTKAAITKEREYMILFNKSNDQALKIEVQGI